jgi:hypothetical protein
MMGKPMLHGPGETTPFVQELHTPNGSNLVTASLGVATLVEHHSRFCMLVVKVPAKDTATVVAALSRHVRQLPATLRRSLTWDRGLQMAQHKSFTMATDVQVYFCDPQCPWQRGSNENTNGLLRQIPAEENRPIPTTRSPRLINGFIAPYSCK